MKTNHQGFTLIELMIVIAIVAILVALAVPSYLDYSVRTRVSECLNAAAVPKVQISDYLMVTGEFPVSLEAAGMAGDLGDSDFCEVYELYVRVNAEGIKIVGFLIEVDEIQVGADSGSVIRPALIGIPDLSGSGAINWYCRAGATTATSLKYLPATCRENVIELS